MELNIAHQPAAHCENGTISSLLRFYGIQLSEPMIFGLASGLYFTHVPWMKMSGLPVTSFRTFPGILFKRITKRLGIKTETRRFLNKEKAMAKLDQLLIKQGKPVDCVVGMYYLPYSPIEYRFHFNGHNISIIGKHDTTNEYAVLASNTTQRVTISYNDLVKVRFAKGGTYPLMGQMYWIESVPSVLPNLSPLILKSIRKTCKEMISRPSFIPWLGTRGILYLSKRIRTWNQTMEKREIALNLSQIIRMLEEIGTGGAGFRFIYGAFLQEAAEKTGIEELNSYSKRITEIGDMWREFAYKGARIIKKRKGETYTLDNLSNILAEIGHQEHKFFYELKQLVEKELK